MGSLFSDVFFGRGWSPLLPTAAIEIMSALVVQGPSRRDEIEDHLRRMKDTTGRLARRAGKNCTSERTTSCAS
ncbi:MAG: hypothetical protein LC799_07165 [Actinobacteria bacterium]|nr:hypothetical protein [Actinomycetota bacterium]